MKLSTMMDTMMGGGEYPADEVKSILDEFEKNVEGLHPNSNTYRSLADNAILRVGIAAGRFWERNGL